MTYETLINEQVVARLEITCHPQGDHQRLDRSEFRRLSDALEEICKDRDAEFVICGRKHKLHFSPDPLKGTSCRRSDFRVDARIALKVIDQQAQRVYLRYTLQRFKDMAWLTCEFNPTSVLCGNNVHPVALAMPGRSLRPYPSSDIAFVRKCLRMGFDVIGELRDQSAVPLFDEPTLGVIDRGEFHLVRTQWCCYYPTPDVPVFLQAIAVMTGQTIAHGRGLINLSDHLGLRSERYRHPDDNLVTGTLLRKFHGKNTVYSCLFYDKRRRVANMMQGKTLSRAETATVRQNVRFDMTAHSIGICEIIKRAQRRIDDLCNDERDAVGSWVDQFRDEEAKPTARSLARAIAVLSREQVSGELRRRSFASWLVPFMMGDVLRFDRIASFRLAAFYRFLEEDDPIATAWRRQGAARDNGWARKLAEAARCSLRTVYSRRDEFLETYGIDIEVPLAFYRDLLAFGPASVTPADDRLRLLLAQRRGESSKAMKLGRLAEARFDEVRLQVVGRAISQPPHKMELKIARDAPGGARHSRQRYRADQRQVAGRRS